MQRFKSAVLALFAIPALAAPALAATLDFDNGTATFAGGDPSTNDLIGYAQHGLVFDVERVSGTDSVSANLFDTTCGSGANCGSAGDDKDLQPGVSGKGVAGNVLILQENRGGLDDDAKNGGEIKFTLVSGSSFRLLGFSAVDDGEFKLVAGFDLPSIVLTADNEVGETTFAVPSPFISVGGSFSVIYSGSRGVDSIDLDIQPVPVPAGLPLLLAGIGALAFAKRRKRTA